MAILDVWLEASPLPIGQLVSEDDGSMAFAYLPDWLGNSAQHPLSLSLPLREEPYGEALTRSFFDNLLQENDQLEAIIQREGLERGDIAGLLAHVGADCAGAISVLPHGHPPIKRPGDLNSDYDAIDEIALADLVKRLTEGRPLPDDMADPSPVAGFRRKISLAALPDNRFGLPRPGTGAPTTHILKVPDPRHPHEARDEAFVTMLADQCGISVGSCIANDVAGLPILLIQRFDRRVLNDGVHRVHQEDFAQALGLPARLKYERNGKPGRKFDAQAIGRILALTDQPALSRAAFLRVTLFNLLIGNNDNHAKNHALLHVHGAAPQLAPFYDLVPVQTVAGSTDQLAFSLGGAERCEEVGLAELAGFCAAIGLPDTGIVRLLRENATELIGNLELLTMQFPREQAGLDRLIGQVAGQLDGALDLAMKLRERDAHILRGGGWLMS